MRWQRILHGCLLASIAIGLAAGCQVVSNHTTKWKMLEPNAVESPIQAVGGDGMVFTPKQEDVPRTREQLASATQQELLDHYAPIFLQQRVNTRQQRYPYPPEFDNIGQASVRHELDGSFKAFVAGDPKVYTLYQKKMIAGAERTQLTYTAWYPAHPRTKAIDLEAADIDSIVLRITLDADNVPLFYETIAASGGFHKVFVSKWVEEAASAAYHGPETDKKYAVERNVKDAIDWEVAGVVDESRDRPGRPVVFVKAGDHKVLGVGSAARLQIPKQAEAHTYALADYRDLYLLNVENSKGEKAPFFDEQGKVWGADRRERFVLAFTGMADAGTPRANDHIRLHYDQSAWDDANSYANFLRLPPQLVTATAEPKPDRSVIITTGGTNK